MDTYKIGNKINCIVRSVASGKLGRDEMLYANQPYTIIKDIEATIRFSDTSKTAKSHGETKLGYTIDNISELTLSNVSLNERILNLMYDETDDILCHGSVNIDVDDYNTLAFSLWSFVQSHGPLYQVFVYDSNRQLVFAQGVMEKEQDCVVTVSDTGNFLVFYSYQGSMGYKLSRTTNTYVALDIEVEGNESDNTNTYFIHLHKCLLSLDKNMYFHNGINTIDLNFKVIPSEEDYITIK